ncbi:MAG: hypothetical protein ABI197_00735 [Granulicella sp.]
MSTARRSARFSIEPRFFLLLAIAVLCASPALSQPSQPLAPSNANALAKLDLPDAPDAIAPASSSLLPEPAAGQGLRSRFDILRPDEERAKQMASPTTKNILPNQLAPRLNAGAKVKLGLVSGATPFSVLGWFLSAGFDHITDGTPNYGVDKGAFGERLGAAALHGYTEEVFIDGVMAPVFHQDPRYYQLGHGHTIMRRGIYAASRALVTRSDDGRREPNYSMIGGNLMAAALTNAYYPQVNRSFGETASTFGSAMGGAALSFLAKEFLSDALTVIHLKQPRN